MSTASRFLWLMSQASGIFFLAWPVALTLIVISGGSFIGWLRQSNRPRLRLMCLTGGLAMPQLILLCGVLFDSGSGQLSHLHSGTGDAVILGLFLGQLALSTSLIVRAPKGARLLSASILMLELLFCFGAVLLASMAITGTWL